MITSIFSKSKPINYVIACCFIVIIFIAFNYQIIDKDFKSIAALIFCLALLVSHVLILDFITVKNNLSMQNGYVIMIFVILLSYFPKVMDYREILYSNVFVLLAIRRLLSLRSDQNITKKLFDIGLWIAFATLFYFWSILFFILILVPLVYYSSITLKKIIVPLLGLAAVFIFLIAYNIIMADQYLLNSNFNMQISFDYTNYNHPKSIIKLTILFTVLVWVVIHYFKIVRLKNKSLKPLYFLIMCTIGVAIIIAQLAPNKTGGEFLFLYAPLSILVANYIAFVKEKWFKEIFVILILSTATIVNILF